MEPQSAYEKKLIEKFNEKGLSPKTIVLYMRNLQMLNEFKPIRSLIFLKDIDKIKQMLQKYTPASKRNFYIAICSITKAMNQQKLYKLYGEDLLASNKSIKAEQEKGLKTEKQEKNWIEWDDVLAHREELKEKVSSVKSKKLTASQYDVLLKYVVLSLYTWIAPRRNTDFTEMYVVKKVPNTERNYYETDTQKFHFNKFKTAKTDGPVTVDIPVELQQVLKQYMKHYPKSELEDKPLLVLFNGKTLNNSNSITRILNSIFKKNISSTMLRHSYLSSKYGNLKDEMEKDAHDMSHSVRIQQEIYVK